MRSAKQFVIDIVRKPPMLFPLVALAHILWFFWTAWDDRHEPFPDIAWLQVVWLAGYTVCWIAACDLRKWGALGYIFLTVLDFSIFLAARNQKVPAAYVSNLCLIDGLFSFFLLFYYKRFS